MRTGHLACSLWEAKSIASNEGLRWIHITNVSTPPRKNLAKKWVRCGGQRRVIRDCGENEKSYDRTAGILYLYLSWSYSSEHGLLNGAGPSRSLFVCRRTGDHLHWNHAHHLCSKVTAVFKKAGKCCELPKKGQMGNEILILFVAHSILDENSWFFLYCRIRIKINVLSL